MLGVVIPSYQRKECLREALQSLVSQTFKRFFVIVVDDHSAEPLESVVNEFQNQLHIIYKYAEVNGGPGAARQIGLEICYKMNLDLVMFMDSDDMLYPHAIARLTQEINRTGNNVISSKFYSEGKQGAGEVISSENKTWLHGKIFRTKYLKENNITFPQIRTNEDLAFCLMVIESTDKRARIDEDLYLFRHEKKSITRNISDINRIARISADYISAIYYAAKFLKTKNKLSTQILYNIVGCYNHYQYAKLFGLIKPEHQEQLRFLINTKEFQDFLKTDGFVQTASEVYQWYKFDNEELKFFRQTFIEWLEEFNESCNN